MYILSCSKMVEKCSKLVTLVALLKRDFGLDFREKNAFGFILEEQNTFYSFR